MVVNIENTITGLSKDDRRLQCVTSSGDLILPNWCLSSETCSADLHDKFIDY